LSVFTDPRSLVPRFSFSATGQWLQLQDLLVQELGAQAA